MRYRLRYVAGSDEALKFPGITYPWHTRPPAATRELAERMRQAMPDPTKFEIVEEV